jgi:hypothetical protein
VNTPVFPETHARRSRVAGRLVELAIASIGLVVLICAASATQSWLDRHFLPSFYVPRNWYVRIETIVRLVAAASGALTFFVRRRLAGVVTRNPAQALHIVVAVVLALGASEVVLRRFHVRSSEWLLREEEPRRRPDARLGWTLAPARTGYLTVGGRGVEYAVDAAGYRVRRVDEPVDPGRPSVLCAGESIVFGEGLMWDESIPAQLGAMTGIQSVNLGVNGYSSDQAYLRLQNELPRFRHPVAVVSLFMTMLFGRNLDDDRPHLGPGLVWLPATPRSRLAALGRLFVPYRSDADVERGVTLTRDVLRATIDRARARGAAPLIVVPHLGPENPIERALRHHILDEGGLPYLWVEIDAEWQVPGDGHPDARGAHAIAAAIAALLRK